MEVNLTSSIYPLWRQIDKYDVINNGKPSIVVPNTLYFSSMRGAKIQVNVS